MITKIGFISNNKQLASFTGKISIVKKEMYAVNDAFAKIVEKKSNKSFIENLAVLTRKSVAELKQKLNLNDETIKEINDALRQMKSRNIGFNSANRENAAKTNFKQELIGLLKKQGLINSKNEFDKLPAKMIVIGKGETLVSDNLNLVGAADKIVLRKGAKLKSLVGQKVVARGLDDAYAPLKIQSMKDLHVSNSKTGSLESADAFYGSNVKTTGGITAKSSIKGSNMTVSGDVISKEGHISSKGINDIKGDVTAKYFVEGSNMTVGGDVKSKNLHVHLSGNNNIKGDVTAKYSVEGEQMTVGGNLISKERQVSLSGSSDIKGDVIANYFVKGSNMTVGGDVISKESSVELRGINKVKGDVITTKFIKSFGTVVSGKIKEQLSVIDGFKKYFSRPFQKLVAVKEASYESKSIGNSFYDSDAMENSYLIKKRA